MARKRVGMDGGGSSQSLRRVLVHVAGPYRNRRCAITCLIAIRAELVPDGQPLPANQGCLILAHLAKGFFWAPQSLSITITILYLSYLSHRIASPRPFLRVCSTDNMMASNSSSQPTCQNCTTSTTPLWRRDEFGAVLCNACGLFLKLHGRSRPISLKTDVIKSRNRVKTMRPDLAPKKKVRSRPRHPPSPPLARAFFLIFS